jgi:hypothetical protein
MNVKKLILNKIIIKFNKKQMQTRNQTGHVRVELARWFPLP